MNYDAAPWPVQYVRAAPAGTQPRSRVDLPLLERCLSEHHAVVERQEDNR
jgi:hypothetical protein